MFAVQCVQVSSIVVNSVVDVCCNVGGARCKVAFKKRAEKCTSDDGQVSKPVVRSHQPLSCVCIVWFQYQIDLLICSSFISLGWSQEVESLPMTIWSPYSYFESADMM